MRAPDTVRMGVLADRAESPTSPIDVQLETPELIDRLIAIIDERIGRQVDVIIHHPEFQALEAAWRGLEFVVDRVANANVTAQVCVWQCSKEQLVADLEDNADRTKSTFYGTVYSAEYGQHGGKPYAAIFANFDVSSSPQDVELLKGASAVAAMAHAMLFVSAAPALFGVRSFEDLVGVDIEAIFEAPQLARWNALREASDSRYLGVVLPRFLLRSPYRDEDESAETFIYNERVANLDEQLWGSATYALSVAIADSYVRTGTAMGMIGAFIEPPVRTRHRALTREAQKPAVDVVLSHGIELSLSDQGFIVLLSDPIECTFGIASANSLQKPAVFGGKEGPQDTLNHALAAQVPYLLFASAFAHKVKIIQREQLGSHQTPSSIEGGLNTFLGQYVNKSPNPSPADLQRYPLRRASIRVREVEGQSGWFATRLRLWPHMLYMGSEFGLELPGRLDRR